MKERNKLTIEMALLFFIVFVFFGVIIVNEKLSPLKIPKVTKKISTYLNNNYKEIKNEVNLDDVIYNEMKYQAKVSNKDNKNLYFYIYYKDKKITDTYKDDYVKGKSIINYQQEKIKNNIKSKTHNTYQIKILNSLDKYTNNLKEKIINTSNPENLKIYNLETELTVNSFATKNITNTIISFVNNLNSKKITPKNYTFTIINPEDETIAVKIYNINYDLIKSKDFTNIINSILLKNNNALLKNYNIKYEYLN